MIVSFFEEFPTKKNMEKLKLVAWPTKLYLAAASLDEFNKLKSNIRDRNVKEVVYWPILKRKEGYWFSAFSDGSAVSRVLGEVKADVPVMIDAELPTTRNPLLYLTQSALFHRNKRRLHDFVGSHKNVYVAEYYPSSKLESKVMSFFGLHFDPKLFNNKVIKMFYTSMHPFRDEDLVCAFKDCKDRFGDNFIIAYGTTARGVQGNEPILLPDELDHDLRLAKKAKVREVVIFRLGGLNKEYCSVIRDFTR